MLTVNHKFFLCETSKTKTSKQANNQTKKQNTWFTIVTPKHKEKKKKSQGKRGETIVNQV